MNDQSKRSAAKKTWQKYPLNAVRIALSIAWIISIAPAFSAESPAPIVKPAAKCDAKNTLCVGMNVVYEKSRSSLIKGKIIAINQHSGTYEVDYGSPIGIKKETASDIGRADSFACGDSASLCVSQRVYYLDQKNTTGSIVAVFPDGHIGVVYDGNSHGMYLELPDDLTAIDTHYLAWVYGPDAQGRKQVIGCAKKDSTQPGPGVTQGLNQCENSLATRVVWNDATRVCEYLTAEGAFIAERPVADCLAGATYAWLDDASTSCGAFSSEEHFIETVPVSNCKGVQLECLHGSGVLASTLTANLFGVVYHLLPDIMDLKTGQTVPPEDYKKYSSTLIAASLVARKHEVEESDANAAQPAFDYRVDTLIQMKINDQTVGKVLQSGGFFLNQHQTGASDGKYAPQERAGVEDTFIGVNLEANYGSSVSDAANTVRPKYAFLAFKSDSDGEHHGSFSRDYGNVVVVFKDEVKSRTTFAPVDSLIGFANSMPGFRVYTTAYRSAQPIHKLTYAPNFGDYWEAQMWGALSLYDVSYFMVGCPGDAPVSSDTLALLRQINLPIYQCEFVSDHSHFAKGNLIDPGNPAKAPKAPLMSGSDTSKFQAN